MSLNVLSVQLMTSLAAEGDTFETPGVRSFWWPLVGGDHDNFAFTRPSLVMILSVVFLGWFFVSTTRRLALVPSKRQWLTEQTYDFVRNTIARDVIGTKDFRRFLPLLFTLFTLILVNNIAGIIPFVQYPTTSRIAFPIVLTLVVYVVYHVVGIRSKGGIGKYLGGMVPAGLPGWLKPIMFVLELLTYFFVRPLTLALRLFGNMMAGHLMLLVFILGGEYLLLHGDNFALKGAGVLSFAFSILMTAFELLIEFLQAFIFTMLTALYLADSLSEHH
ncbi:MAG: F0F1 ATP synthase subunit A [Tetrasphaera jenkinsii]|uniref:F0F1 ATP synthase subunit A n=1 Tax=Nostocoides jenkinsii TaxID=330834 RepID=UPI000A69E9ED|nr:F0F1 ATP synthase subunit A [Tetrasphaera jenkinsii]MCI1261695.1 F0F1 ATP synthase subunit A [Tetrasphaera jenkinsii]